MICVGGSDARRHGAVRDAEIIIIVFASLFATLALGACSTRGDRRVPAPDLGTPPPFDFGPPDMQAEGPDLGPLPDRAPLDAPFDPDMSCATATATATVTRRPVDIIWVVDNSSSMREEIENVAGGLDAFARYIADRDLDYRVILLSLKCDTSGPTIQCATTRGGSARYGVCVRGGISGGTRCEDGPRFFHVDCDIKSTQPLEQVLGTLGQTMGYTEGTERGSRPWRWLLRPEATKAFVFVTDDNARLGADRFEHFRGEGPPPWRNPVTTSTSLFLPPGILEPEWGGLFEGYKANAIYGYACPSGADPGATYTELVRRTGGVRADICAPPSSWGALFESIATAVVESSRIDCELDIPEPSPGFMLSPNRLNVQITPRSGDPVRLGRAADAAACGTALGWYYDDPAAPTKVILCPSACERAQAAVDAGGASIEVQFGCESALI
jgi:hypothetical protein